MRHFSQPDPVEPATLPDADPSSVFDQSARLPPSPVSALLRDAANSLDQLPQWLQQYGAQLQQGSSLAELKGVPAQELERQYALAYSLCQAQQWQDALPILLNLIAHHPLDARWHFACGMCLQQLDEPVLASVSYAQALLLEPEDAACAFRLGESLAAAGQPQAARDALVNAVELINADYERCHHLLEPAQNILRQLESSSAPAGAGHG